MPKITLDVVRGADPEILRFLERSRPLPVARKLFVLALIVPVVVCALSFGTGVSIYRAALDGLLAASASTAAAAPLLANAYRAHVLRTLMSRTLEADALGLHCRRLRTWTYLATASLFAIAASLNLTALWPIGSYTLGVELWDLSLMPWLRHALVAGLCGLVVSDRALTAA
ncbi:hypothetical protein ACFFGH_18440 [Lysobacter korlensis]|uniref:Uncharacterized protein n=1 Tax=Lysobacter korlensis TaxID=553636 RepID=A0ABV6RV72_9GAMM